MEPRTRQAVALRIRRRHDTRLTNHPQQATTCNKENTIENNTIIASDSEHPTTVFGVHGGDGTLLWKRMSTGSHLHADWDSFEWVALHPGDRAGSHLHAHTEELFYFLSGSGVVVMDGVTHRVEPGSAVLTPLGSTHSVDNDGEEYLAYIVVEVFPPSISGALPPRRPTEEAAL